MRTDRPERQSGFTLIELLIALILFGMLTVVLFVSLRFGAMTLHRVSTHQTGTDDLTATDHVLRQWLASAYPEYIPDTLAGMPGYANFDGEPETIVFLAPAPQSLAAGGLAVMQIAIQVDGSIKDLVLSARPELAWPGENAATNEILVAGISGLEMSYWGPDRADEPPYWHRNWNNRPHLPELVRISLQFPAGDTRHWPALLIAPMIDIDDGCQLVTLTQTCLGR